MRRLQPSEQAVINNTEPQNQNVSLGSRLMTEENNGVLSLLIPQTAGAAGVVTPFTPGLNYVTGLVDPDLIFDFEIMEIQVRTESAVASSTATLKQGSNAISEAIVSAVADTVTLGATIHIAYNKFYPKSNPAGYAAAPLTVTDAGGATAPQRTVALLVRRL